MTQLGRFGFGRAGPRPGQRSAEAVWGAGLSVEKQLPGQDHIKGHKSRELHIVTATAKDCR